MRHQSKINMLSVTIAISALLAIPISAQAQTDAKESTFCSHLPIVIATLKDKPFPPIDMSNPESSKAKRPVSLQIYDANASDSENGPLNCLTDNSAKMDATMHYRGSSSLGFPKHQFGVKLAKSWKLEEDPSLKTKHFLGMPYGGKSWIFSAEQPNLDGTYLRNSLSFYLQNKFNDILPNDNNTWGPRTRFFELFIQNPNDAKPNYIGLYNVAEAIEFNDHRIDLKKSQMSLLYKIDQPTLKSCDIPVKDESTNETFIVYDTHNVKLIDLDKIDCKKALPDFWTQAFSFWTKSLKTPGEDKQMVSIGGQEHLVTIKTDTDSFAMSFLINELIKDPDGYNRNTFFYQVYNSNDETLTMYAGPLWDKNLGYDLHLPNPPFTHTGGYSGYPEPYKGVDNWTFPIKYQFWKDTFQLPEVQYKICEYWTNGISKQILSNNALVSFIQKNTAWINHKASNEMTTPVERDTNVLYPVGGYSEYSLKVTMLIDYIDGRMAYLTKQLGSTQTDCLKNIKAIFPAK